MTSAYTPQPGSAGARAIAHLQDLGESVEISNGQLAEALQLSPSSLSALLNSAMRHKMLVRVQRHGKPYWVLGPAVGAPPAPPPTPAGDEDDLPQVARIVPAASAAPLAFVSPQSWCPAPAEVAGSPDEPESPPPSPPAPALGLGWKAPRTPGFLADAPPPSVAAPEPAPEPARAVAKLVAMPDEHYVVDADFDPDFQEVATSAPAREPVHIDLLPNDPPPADAAPAPERSHFLCALWSNGELEMQLTSGRLVRLTAEDTRGLLRYVSDSLSARARAAA